MAVFAVGRIVLWQRIVDAWTFPAALVGSALVLAVGDWLDVFRVAASAVIAGVVWLCSFRHRAVDILPNKAVWSDPDLLAIPAPLKDELTIAKPVL